MAWRRPYSDEIQRRAVVFRSLEVNAARDVSDERAGLQRHRALRIEFSGANPQRALEHRHEPVIVVKVRLAPHVWAALHDVGVQPRLGGIAVQTRGRAVLGVSPLHLVRQRVVPAAPIYGDRLRATQVLYRERSPSQGHNNGGRADRQRTSRADGHRRAPSRTHLTPFHITSVTATSFLGRWSSSRRAQAICARTPLAASTCPS
jgi:hypothetical protein